MINLGINGLGRIGKCVFRAVYELGLSSDFKITALNSTSKDSAHSIKYDSVHGVFPFDIKQLDSNIITVDHKDGRLDKIQVYNTRDPSSIPWSQNDVDIVLECTGSLNSKEKAKAHIDYGRAKKVIVSAPCKDADATIVYGVNNHNLEREHLIISAASCTTNALAPLIQVLVNNLGFVQGHATTVHAYTNDQKVLDGSHKDPRRSRACNLSMIPTTSGAAKLISKIIPYTENKLDVCTIRVPIPNVSLIDMSFITQCKTSIEDINNKFASAASSDMKNIIDISKQKLVSIDFNHTQPSCILDINETRVIDQKFCRIAAWYDNEWAFSIRMLDLAKLAFELG